MFRPIKTDDPFLDGVHDATRWLLIVVFIGLCIMLAYDMAHAEGLSLTVSGGVTSYLGPSLPDSVWYQRGNNYNMDNTALNWGASLNYAFNPRWSASLGYRNVGTTRISATFWDDPDYDLKSKSCKARCNQTGNLVASDAMQLVELSATRTWRNESGYFVGLRAGGAYAFHRFTVERLDIASFQQKFYGNVPMGLVAVQVGWKAISIETAYYQKVGPGYPDSYPISTQFVLTTLNVTVPLW